MEQKEQYKNNFNNFVDSPFVKWISIIIGLAGFFGFFDNTNSMIFSQPVCIFILFL